MGGLAGIVFHERNIFESQVAEIYKHSFVRGLEEYDSIPNVSNRVAIYGGEAIENQYVRFKSHGYWCCPLHLG